MNVTFKTPTDFRRSLEARLKSYAVKKQQDLQRIRRKVAFERFLARIFYPQSSDFILKGGYAMELRIASARATKDIDLTCLHRVEESKTTMNELITQELQELVKHDLNDYFTFEISKPRMDLDNAPYGGARYSVASFIDKRLFVRFQLDVGADAIIDDIEFLEGCNWLGHYGVENPKMRMISIEQQLAEKFHAYSLPQEQRINTRTKDLIDMLLLLKLRQIDSKKLRDITEKVFKVRAVHLLPKNLNPPPPDWTLLYDDLSRQCGITLKSSKTTGSLRGKFVIAAGSKNLKLHKPQFLDMNRCICCIKIKLVRLEEKTF